MGLLQDGKVYQIKDETGSCIYVGSTTGVLKDRFATHKSSSKRGSQPLYRFVQKRELGWDGLQIELIEVCPCKSVRELRTRESYHIATLRPPLNVSIPWMSGLAWKLSKEELFAVYDWLYTQRKLHRQTYFTAHV